MNVFTDASRDERWEVGVKDLCSQLRAPAALTFLKDDAKPNHMSTGDWILKATLDAHLMALISAGRYREVYRTLVRLFPPAVTEPDTRQNGPKK
jgi:hypothetical protein